MNETHRKFKNSMKAKLIKEVQKELDRRSKAEELAVSYMADNQLEKARRILALIDDELIKRLWKQLEELGSKEV